MAWYDPKWSGRVMVSTNTAEIDADLTDFPVVFTDSMFDSSHVIFSEPKSDGSDFRTTKGQSTEQPIEVTLYDQALGYLEIHTKYDGVLPSDETVDIGLYFGNPDATAYAEDATYGREAVWDASFELVAHLGEDGNTSVDGYLDSTSNDYDGTGTAMTSSDDEIAILGYGQHMDGSTQYISFDSALSITGAFTYEVWCNRDVANTLHLIWNNYFQNGGGMQFQMYVDGSSNVHVNKPFSADVIVTTSAAVGTGWHHLVATRDGTDWRLYIDGAEDSNATATRTLDATTDRLRLGVQHNNGSFDSYFDGVFDEARVSSTQRSADWVAATYSNQNSPTTFFTVSNVQRLRRNRIMSVA